jgi:hypothetical protein
VVHRAGGPQFADRYSAKDRLHYLAVSLAVLVAFELGAAPELSSALLPLLVVPPVYGEGAGEGAADKLAHLPFLSEPWTRVPVVLAAFSVLYLTVALLTEEGRRTYFFSAANEALQQRLAVRIAYRLRLCDPRPAPGEYQEAAAAAAPTQPTAAPAASVEFPVVPGESVTSG